MLLGTHKNVISSYKSMGSYSRQPKGERKLHGVNSCLSVSHRLNIKRERKETEENGPERRRKGRVWLVSANKFCCARVISEN